MAHFKAISGHIGPPGGGPGGRGAAAILNQTSTIDLLTLASVILQEPFIRRKAVAAGLALCGILLVLRPVQAEAQHPDAGGKQ